MLGLRGILSILCGIVIAGCVVTLLFMRFTRLEEIYQAKTPEAAEATKKKYAGRYRYCFIVITVMAIIITFLHD